MLSLNRLILYDPDDGSVHVEWKLFLPVEPGLDRLFRVELTRKAFLQSR